MIRFFLEVILKGRKHTHRKKQRQQLLLCVPHGMSLAEPQPPGSKVAFFSSPLNLCGSYSPSRAAPTKSTLLSSTVVIFRSRSGAICLCDLCWENSLWKTGHSKFLRLSSFDLQLSSSQVAQGQVVFFLVLFFLSIHQERNSAFTCPPGEAQ